MQILTSNTHALLLCTSVLCAALACGQAQAAPQIQVGGAAQQLSLSDFERQGNTYIAEALVIGDEGQKLTFDIDATVTGHGYQRMEGSDQQQRTNFRFSAELQVTCNGMAIGSDMGNHHALINGTVNNTQRELALAIDRSRVTQGECNALNFTLKGIELKDINALSLAVRIAEAI